jgi:hypothetical protein
MNHTEKGVRALLEQGNELGAIRLVRETMGCGLREAQEYIAAVVEQWQTQREQTDTDSPPIPTDLTGRMESSQLTREEWIATLQKGLYLERRKVFLSWNASLSKLEGLGAPLEKGRRGFLIWPDESILGGLTGSVSTGTLLSLRGLYHINCQPDASSAAVTRHLCRVLGPPIEKITPGKGGLWRFGKVEIALRLYDPNPFHSAEAHHEYVEIHLLDEKADGSEGWR